MHKEILQTTIYSKQNQQETTRVHDIINVQHSDNVSYFNTFTDHMRPCYVNYDWS